MANEPDIYYVPKSSHWPIVTCIALFCMAVGAGNWVHGNLIGPFLLGFGVLLLLLIKFGWFRSIIREGMAGQYNAQVKRSFRWGMVWFIVTETFFFGAFFGALLYARFIIVPWLGGTYGTSESMFTHLLLWPNFHATWPLLQSPAPSMFPTIKQGMGAWGIATINTVVLLVSSLTITWAYWATLAKRRKQMLTAMICTILLGIAFITLQSIEYWGAYMLQGLTLGAGIYGATFFVLTGIDGFHVLMGIIMLTVILVRCWKGHFRKDHMLGFEAVSWYWHFVDIMWLIMFIIVYWL